MQAATITLIVALLSLAFCYWLANRALPPLNPDEGEQRYAVRKTPACVDERVAARDGQGLWRCITHREGT